MADRLTIYAGAPVTSVLRDIGPGAPGQGGDPYSKSGRLNTVCERYLMMVRACRPQLSRGEWLALCDVLNGTLMDEAAILGLEADIEDSDPEQLAGWGVVQGDLAARVAALTIPERIAVADTVERWWRAEGSHDERLRTAMLQAR